LIAGIKVTIMNDFGDFHLTLYFAWHAHAYLFRSILENNISLFLWSVFFQKKGFHVKMGTLGPSSWMSHDLSVRTGTLGLSGGKDEPKWIGFTHQYSRCRNLSKKKRRRSIFRWSFSTRRFFKCQ